MWRTEYPYTGKVFVCVSKGVLLLYLNICKDWYSQYSLKNTYKHWSQSSLSSIVTIEGHQMLSII